MILTGPRFASRAGVLCLCVLSLVCATSVSSRAGYPEKGARGYGLSVFQGTEPERFEVEILGRVEGMGSTGTTILARLSGPGVDLSGVQQGMSGSPVYIDGELVGAVMSTWAFALEPIAGIRPIDEMRRLAEDQGDASGYAPDTSLEGRVDELGAASPLIWSASGFDEVLRGSIGRGLGVQVRAAGSASLGSEAQQVAALQPGDAMAVLLVDGDARLFASGTVTERLGDQVLGFGHPFLSAGAVSLPLARAEVVAVLASRQTSFKITAAGAVVGALELDRREGVAGRLGVRADVLPLHVSIGPDGVVPEREFNFQVARLPVLTPQLLAWSTQTALADRNAPGRFSSARVEVVVGLEDQAPLRSRTVAAGPGLVAAASAEAGLLAGLLEGIGGDVPRTESVDVRIALDEHEPVASFGRAKIDEPLLEPGQRLTGRVEVVGHDGARHWIDFGMDLPRQLVPGAYRLRITDGETNFADEIQRTQPRFESMDLESLREALALRGTADRIVVALYGPSSSLILGDAEYVALPPSIHALMAAPGAGRTPTDAAAEVLARWEGQAGSIVRGELNVDLRTRAPFFNGMELPTPETRP